MAAACGAAPLACSLATQGDEYGRPAPIESGAAASSSSSSAASTGSSSGTSSGGGAGQGGALSASTGVGGVLTGSGGSVGAGGSGNGCPSGMGPEMIVVPANPTTGLKAYCIDSTEVSVAQYRSWSNTNPSVSGDPAYCKTWNTTHNSKKGGECDFFDLNLYPAPGNPVGCVNWCDAYAYCKAAGKRLCGAVGGGPNAYSQVSKSTSGQWYIACSAADTLSFPYGNVYDGTACNTTDFDMLSDLPRDVGSIASCVGGYPGLYDMSGNVSEWEDACEAQNGPSDKCQDRSSSYRYGGVASACAYTFGDQRSSAFIDTGFRCCADLP